jgi:hypothetical protein
MRAFGNRDAWRRDVAIHRAVLADVHFFGRSHIADHLAEHDDGLGIQLGLDLAVRTDGEHVIAEIDLAFDVPFDREIFAAVQLALDNDRFPNVHYVPLVLAPHHVVWTGCLCCRSRCRRIVGRHRR